MEDLLKNNNIRKNVRHLFDKIFIHNFNFNRKNKFEDTLINKNMNEIIYLLNSQNEIYSKMIVINEMKSYLIEFVHNIMFRFPSLLDRNDYIAFYMYAYYLEPEKIENYISVDKIGIDIVIFNDKIFYKYSNLYESDIDFCHMNLLYNSIDFKDNDESYLLDNSLTLEIPNLYFYLKELDPYTSTYYAIGSNAVNKYYDLYVEDGEQFKRKIEPEKNLLYQKFFDVIKFFGFIKNIEFKTYKNFKENIESKIISNETANELGDLFKDYFENIEEFQKFLLDKNFNEVYFNGLKKDLCLILSTIQNYSDGIFKDKIIEKKFHFKYKGNYRNYNNHRQQKSKLQKGNLNQIILEKLKNSSISSSPFLKIL